MHVVRELADQPGAVAQHFLVAFKGGGARQVVGEPAPQRHRPRPCGEAQLLVAGQSSSVHCGEQGHVGVDVVVDVDGVLAGVLTQDAAHVLDDAPPGGDRKGQEDRVKGRAVEALAGVGVRGDQEPLTVLGPPLVRPPLLGPQAAVED